MEIGASGSDFRGLGQSWLELNNVNCEGRLEVGIIDNDEFSLFSQYKLWRLALLDQILEVSVKVGYSSIMPTVRGDSSWALSIATSSLYFLAISRGDWSF